MKNMYLLFLTSLLFTFQNSQSQVVVDGVNINELKKVKVCQIVASSRLFSNKVTITIDYGQKIKWASKKGSQVRNENGKTKKFNSVIDAINYMENNGWIYIDSHAVSVPSGMGGSQNVYHYYFRRKSTSKILTANKN